MDIRVRPLGSLISGSASPAGSASGKLRIKTEESLDIKPLDAPEQPASSGRALGDSNAREFARRAENAVDAVSDLRERQLALAEEASQISDPERIYELDQEKKNLEEEIARIDFSATFQGDNVLSGRTLMIDDKAVTLANQRSITGDPGASLATQAEAIDAVATLTESVLTARYAAAASGAAAAKANTDFAPVQTEIQDIQESRSGAVRDPLKAEELARGIAQAIRNNAEIAPEESLLSHNLNPERSKELLE